MGEPGISTEEALRRAHDRCGYVSNDDYETMDEAIMGACREIAALRAEVERLRDDVVWWRIVADRHKAEVERLENENRALTAQLQDALVEIDGLRAALEKGDEATP